jgi:precorrin-6B methylase 1
MRIGASQAAKCEAMSAGTEAPLARACPVTTKVTVSPSLSSVTIASSRMDGRASENVVVASVKSALYIVISASMP